jgi:hypothetical protein
MFGSTAHRLGTIIGTIRSLSTETDPYITTVDGAIMSNRGAITGVAVIVTTIDSSKSNQPS